MIVEQVNDSGGHLGSNLGAVELTLALHRVFDSPHDMILWDTGHQAYVHKLVTGRPRRFPTLRQQGGLSGYPSRTESEHDWIENSHASTVLSYAHGLATAQELQGEVRQHRIVAVIGDGAMTGGMAYEGLNNLGHSGRDVIIVLNDNGRSYAPTVSRLSESLSKLRANPTYRRQQARFEQLIGDVPVVGNYLERGLDGAKAAVRADVRAAGVLRGPGRGLPRAARRPRHRRRSRRRSPTPPRWAARSWCTCSPRRVAATRRPRTTTSRTMHDLSELKAGSYTAAFSEAIVAEGTERDPSSSPSPRRCPTPPACCRSARLFPDRLIDVGIAEQHAVTAAAGMAMGGLRPVVAVLLDVPDPGVRPGEPRRRPARAAGHVRARPRRHHRRRRSASHHGVLDMVLLTKVPGHDGVRPVELRRGRARCSTTPSSCRRPGRDPVPEDAPPPTLRAGDVGSGLTARLVRRGDAICIIGVGKMLAAATRGGGSTRRGR